MSGILLTGFRPFGSIPRNPSGEIAAALDGIDVGGVPVHALVLPVVRARALPEALEVTGRLAPRAVVALGLASDRDVIHVEACARNLDDFESGDEAGERIRATAIDPGGPESLDGTLEAEAILTSIRAEGIPARPSRDAGAFLCNHLYYGLLREAARLPAERRFGCVFLHLPGVPECAEAPDGRRRPSRPLEETRRGVLAALACVAAALRATGGG